MTSAVDLFFIVGAKYAIVLSLVLALWCFLKAPRDAQKRIAFFGMVALPLIYCTALIASHFYDNPRPFVVGNFTPLIPHAPDNGFPSDHMLLASAVAAIISFYSRRMGAILWVLALYIGISRVSVGVHHPLDIMGSAVIALVIALLVFWGMSFWRENNVPE